MTSASAQAGRWDSHRRKLFEGPLPAAWPSQVGMQAPPGPPQFFGTVAFSPLRSDFMCASLPGSRRHHECHRRHDAWLTTRGYRRVVRPALYFGPALLVYLGPRGLPAVSSGHSTQCPLQGQVEAGLGEHAGEFRRAIVVIMPSQLVRHPPHSAFPFLAPQGLNHE